MAGLLTTLTALFFLVCLLLPIREDLGGTSRPFPFVSASRPHLTKLNPGLYFQDTVLATLWLRHLPGLLKMVSRRPLVYLLELRGKYWADSRH